MPQLWSAAAAMELKEFLDLRDRFVARHGELKRLSDTFYKECYSPLHKVNPNMVPMTFRGMQMLDRLGRAGCSIPPLAPPPGTKTLLLEAMPGAALRGMRLPFKGYKNGAHAPELRQKILEGLAGQSGLRLPNLGDFYGQGTGKPRWPGQSGRRRGRRPLGSRPHQVSPSRRPGRGGF